MGANMNGTIGVIYGIITFCIIILVILIGVIFYVVFKNRKKSEGENDKVKSSSKNSAAKLQGIESMSKFLAFDQIVDSMIVRKNRQQYVMVIQCKGVNYDLLGEEEKLAVEGGFVQFLNTLRFPIQLYVQTRSLNLKHSIDQYSKKINEVNEEIVKLNAQIAKEKANGRLDLVKRMEFDRKRKINILEYGTDITNYVARMSQNRSVLKQNTYVVVSYYTSEFGGEIANYSKEEIDNIAFSELYTRAQTLIRGLASAGVTGKVITSEELAELLYIAYNRDESELINIKRSVDAQYDSLYNTAKDTIEKQKEMIEDKVEKEAVELVANSLADADKIMKLKERSKQEIKERAIRYLQEYKDEMTSDLYNETLKQIEKSDSVKTGKKSDMKNRNARRKTSVNVLSDEDNKIKSTIKRKIQNVESET